MALVENLTDAMKVLLSTREDLVFPWTNEQAEDDAVMLSCRTLPRLLNERGWKGVMSMLVRLWNDEGIKKSWQQSLASGLPCMECLSRFLDDPIRVCDQVRN
ncbi:uncharacterized protein [Littorina saxatilis]|uniref:uncharacterized protein n=1 Tax=Littorina saxatilis TaxID=31220 RepID=UPI0038B5C48E